MRHFETTRQGIGLAEECDAFLLGDLAEYHASRALTVPAWEWMNVLAHGSTERLRAVRDVVDCPFEEARPWCEARSFLATVVLEVAERHCTLSDLQRDVLVPFELQLASFNRTLAWGPSWWAVTTQTVLDRHCADLRQRHTHTVGDGRVG